MSVAAFWEKNRSAQVNEKGERTYTRKFLVQMTALSDGPPAPWVIGGGGPGILRYASYPGDIEAQAVSLDCQPVSDQLGYYELTYTYKSVAADNEDPSQHDQSTPPASRPPTVKFGAVHYERILAPKDLGTPPKDVVNSAGQPFTDPPIMVPTSDITITLGFYRPISYDIVTKQLLFIDSVNDANYTPPLCSSPFLKDQLRCTEFGASTEYENGAAFWHIEVVLQCRRDGWNPIKVLDAGTMKRESLSLPPQPILGKDGQQINKPIPLGPAGQPLNAGAALHYLEFIGYDRQSFTGLLA